MATTLTQIITPQVVANSITTYYTVPTGKKCVTRAITFCNPTGTARTVSVYIVPSGGSADNTTTLLKSYAVDTLETLTPSDLQNHVLQAGDTIDIIASSASSITVLGSGTEVS